MKLFGNESGQAVLESIASLVGMICLCTVILGTCGLYLIKICVSHYAHEALVCELSHSSASSSETCENNLRRQVSGLLGSPKVKRMDWKKSRNFASLVVYLEPLKILTHKTQSFTVLKKVTLPLELL